MVRQYYSCEHEKMKKSNSITEELKMLVQPTIRHGLYTKYSAFKLEFKTYSNDHSLTELRNKAYFNVEEPWKLFGNSNEIIT